MPGRGKDIQPLSQKDIDAIYKQAKENEGSVRSSWRPCQRIHLEDLGAFWVRYIRQGVEELVPVIVSKSGNISERQHLVSFLTSVLEADTDMLYAWHRELAEYLEIPSSESGVFDG